MAHAAGASQKEHRHRRHRGHDAGVVSGAAHQAMRDMPDRRDRRAEQSGQAWIGRDGRVFFLLSDLKLHAPARCQAQRASPLSSATAAVRTSSFAWRMSMLKPRQSRHHVGGAGRNRQGADSRS